MKIQVLNKFVVAVAAILVAAAFANAQCPGSPGCLDSTTFGSGGAVTTFVSGTNFYPMDAAIQSDGKLLALGRVYDIGPTDVIIRYNADGSLDTGFGSGGFAYLYWRDVNGVRGLTMALALQMVGSEERIIVAGWGPNGSLTLRVERYLSNGSLDLTFGSGGTADVNGGIPQDLAVQADGKILAVSSDGNSAANLVRLDPDGTLDSSFGTGGMVALRTPANRPRAVALQSDGRILVAGYTTNVKGKFLMAVSRFNTNGSLDNGGRDDSTRGDSFGKGGSAAVDFPSGAKAEAVALDGGGKVLVAGRSNGDFAIARLSTGGVLDTTFGSGGKSTADLYGTDDAATDIALQSNGKILLIGRGGSTPSDSYAGLARFNSNGSLDGTFGLGGKVTSDFSTEAEYGFRGKIQLDPGCSCQKTVVFGAADFGGTRFAIAARYVL